MNCEQVPTVVHDCARRLSRPHVPRLLLQLADGTLLRRFALVDQAGWHFDHDLVDRRSVLLLQEKFRASGLVQNRHDPYAVDGGIRRAGLEKRKVGISLCSEGILDWTEAKWYENGMQDTTLGMLVDKEKCFGGGNAIDKFPIGPAETRHWEMYCIETDRTGINKEVLLRTRQPTQRIGSLSGDMDRAGLAWRCTTAKRKEQRDFTRATYRPLCRLPRSLHAEWINICRLHKPYPDCLFGILSLN